MIVAMEEPIEDTKSEQLTDRFAEIFSYIFVTAILVGLSVKILFF